MSVRVWKLATFGVVVVILAVGIRAVMGGLADRKLLREGVRVDATVENIVNASRNASRTQPLYLTLSFLLPGERERRKIVGHSTPMPGFLSRGDVIPIVLDARDMRRWTDRVEPVGWLTAMSVPLVLTPLVLILLTIARRERGRYTRIWANGTPHAANTVDVHKSALVPGQKVVKVSIAGSDGRVISVTHPDRLGTPERGQTLQVIAMRPDARHAIVADAYV